MPQAKTSFGEVFASQFWAVLIFVLPIPTFFGLCLVTQVLPEQELLKAFSSVLLFPCIGLVLVAVLFWLFRGFRPFQKRVDLSQPDAADSAQKRLIEFPKQILIVGMTFGIAVSGILVLFNPSTWERLIEFLLLGYANAIFFAMPCYIVFLQSFERWNRFVPFSSKHLSMSLMARVSLVTGFTLTSIFCVALLAFKNAFAVSGEDVTAVASATSSVSTWGKVLQVGVPIAVIGLTGGLLNIILLMRGILRRIQRSKDFVLHLAAGEVDQKPLELTSRDELGVLADHLNLVQNNLNALLGSTKHSVQKTVSIKDELIDICSSTTQEISAIARQVALADHQAQEITEAADRALGRVQKFYEAIAVLEAEIHRQTEMVEETSSALEEMTSSIESVAKISSARMESSQSLEGQTGEGQEKLKLTLGHLNQIATSVEDIRSITSVIQAIAAQTNLLSMNAAIEAAHAGESGAGFAVVADEIRKLAQTSSTNSKEITGKVKSIIQLIGSAVGAGGATANTFEKIQLEVGAFLQSFREIESTMGEMRQGSTAILNSSLGLKERSVELKDKATVMSQEADGLFQDVTLLKEKAQATRSAMDQVGGSVEEVDQVSKNLKGHSQLLDQSTREVSSHIDQFKIQEA